MITNAIAEMRTYGEGSPLLQTRRRGCWTRLSSGIQIQKLFFRLPDGDDRELAGKSVALTDNQIQEIAKLPKRCCSGISERLGGGGAVPV